MRLTREVRFSVDRDWAGHITFAQPIGNSWGGWPSAVGVVPYLRLRATVSGSPDARTGYLCNIAEIDRILREEAIPYVADVLKEHGWRIATERLIQTIWPRVVQAMPPGATLECLELLTTPTLRYSLSREDPAMVHMTQQFEFSASHRLHCAELSDDANRRIFGKCNHPSGHGHNYLVDVTVEGAGDARTGAVWPLPEFERTIKACVIDVLDHKYLNTDVPQFRNVNPSVENIARVIWDLIEGHCGPARLRSVRVYETAKTWADYAGEA